MQKLGNRSYIDPRQFPITFTSEACLNQTLIADARAVAVAALRAASVDAIHHLKATCENGGLNGKRFDSCFYGTLARGSGIEYGSHVTDGEAIERTLNYAKSIGVTIDAGNMNALEKFCAHVTSNDTAETSTVLMAVSIWCDEVLAERKPVSAPDTFDLTDYRQRRRALVGT